MQFIAGIAIGIFVGIIVAIFCWDPGTEKAYKDLKLKYEEASNKSREEYGELETWYTNSLIQLGSLKKKYDALEANYKDQQERIDSYIKQQRIPAKEHTDDEY